MHTFLWILLGFVLAAVIFTIGFVAGMVAAEYQLQDKNHNSL